MIESSKEKKEDLYYQRFDPIVRFMHLIVIISFISLAFTGMVIKFSGVGVFQVLSKIMGGYEVTGFIHRVAAFFTLFYLIAHLGLLVYNKKVKKRTLKYMFSGENSMVPSKRDAIELWQTLKWFFRAGPRPEYGRWTYWEKFDYFAVFWGVIIIGLSGLILWFPEFFTSIGIPGEVINIATIIHSDEALLATGFIFTIHFFNTHFRPDKFPMDMVIFTGRVLLEEFKEDRPRQYKYLVETGQLESRLVGPPNPTFVKVARIFGFTALSFGLFLIVLIIYAMVFVYR
ncbi:MAG: cytochrome b/b6 domain-containing protein [Melioribacteraceae bacterium]|nr:cytochrome b/b6 domain-containing protein [Melioribacteraceae bacterium]